MGQTGMGWCVGDGDTESLSGEMMSEEVQRPEVGVGLEVGGRMAGEGQEGRAVGNAARKLGMAPTV